MFELAVFALVLASYWLGVFCGAYAERHKKPTAGVKGLDGGQSNG